jgi:hypothetical protein
VSPKNSTQLMVAKVPKDVNEPMEQEKKEIVKHTAAEMMASKAPGILSGELFDIQKGESKFCADNVCCEFDLEYERLEIPEDKVSRSKRFDLKVKTLIFIFVF